MTRARKTLLALAVAVVLLVLADLQIRDWYPLAGRGFFVEHPRRFWALRPGTNGLFDGWLVRVDSLGLRGEEPGPRQPGEVRILLLGDSCTFGDQVDQTGTLDRWLERGLQEATGRPVRVFNGGVPGYSSFQGLDLVRKVAPALRPDLLVEAYFYADSSKDFVPDHERLPPPPLDRVRELLWESGVYRMLRSRWLGPGRSIDLSWDRMRPDHGTVARVSPERMEENLRRLARDSGARRCLFLLLPARVRQSEPSDPHRQAVARAAAAAGGLFLDLQDAWLDRPPGDLRRRFSDEIHPTALGFQALAEELVPVLAPWVEEVPPEVPENP